MSNRELPYRCGLLCVDNPVGAGFSIAATTEDIPKDQYSMAGHLYYALQNFFTQNPTFQKRPFFLAGESYAGKYIPALAYYIMAESPMGPPFPKLAGIAIGNGLTDPRIQVIWYVRLAHNLWFPQFLDPHLTLRKLPIPQIFHFSFHLFQLDLIYGAFWSSSCVIIFQWLKCGNKPHRWDFYR